MAFTAPTPYVTPPILLAEPTGIGWNTLLGRDAKQASLDAVLWNICAQASAEVDEYANNVMRATVNQEALMGPGDFRFQLRPDGTARLLLSASPVISILGGQYAASSTFPRVFTALSASDFAIEKPPLSLYSTSPSGAGEGGLAVFLKPGVASWRAGRAATLVEVQYVAGWPHCGLTQDVEVGATTLHVDEVAGWVSGTVGATGVVYDETGQEAAQVIAASATSGPGTLTLASPLTSAHLAGTLVTTLPQSITWAAVTYAMAEALSRGATATKVQQAPGTGANTSGGPDALRRSAEGLLSAYRRPV